MEYVDVVWGGCTQVLSCPIMSCHVMEWNVTCYHVIHVLLSCHVMSCHVTYRGHTGVVDTYITKMQQFMRTLTGDTSDTPTSSAIDPSSPLSLTLTRHRTYIIEEILNLRCPSCRTVFIDYTGCDALTCSSCGIAFCALCLVACGADAHPHLAKVHGKCMIDII